MNSLPQQRGNGNRPVPRIFEVDGDGTATAVDTQTAARRPRRDYYVARASAEVELCLRARTRADAEQEAQGWLEHLLHDDSSELLVRSVVDGVDVARVSRGTAEEFFGANIAMLDPPKRCQCGDVRGRGRRLCDGCRLARLRHEHDRGG